MINIICDDTLPKFSWEIVILRINNKIIWYSALCVSKKMENVVVYSVRWMVYVWSHATSHIACQTNHKWPNNLGLKQILCRLIHTWNQWAIIMHDRMNMLHETTCRGISETEKYINSFHWEWISTQLLFWYGGANISIAAQMRRIYVLQSESISSRRWAALQYAHDNW